MIRVATSWLFPSSGAALSKLTNEELASKAISHKAARDLLVTRLSDDLLYFVQSRLTNVMEDSYSKRQAALDIVQSVWLTWLSKPQLFRSQGEGSFKAWLFSVARRRVIDAVRVTSKCLDEQIDDTQPLYTQSHLDELVEHANLVALHKAMLTLPFLQGEALSLQLEGFTLYDIANITNSNQETVKTRLRYAKNALAHALNSGAHHER